MILPSFDLMRHVERLEKENRLLYEAVEIYAGTRFRSGRSGWEGPCFYLEDNNGVRHPDGGELAREVIRRLEQKRF